MLSRQARARLEALAPRRVLLLRALKLGDMLCAVPALRALRAALPRAEIVLVGLPWAAELVERYPGYLDGFRAFPGYPGLPEQPPDLPRLLSFLAGVQAERFDFAVQMHGSGGISNPLAALFGARRLAGFHVPGAWCPDPELFLPYPEDGLEVRRLLALTTFLGAGPCGEHLEFPILARDEQALRQALGPRDLPPGEYVCIHPGASVPQRRWPVERFTAVAGGLAERGFRIALTGTAGEAALTAAVARHLPEQTVDLAGRTDLGSAAALLHAARLLVCNDTGVSHLAAALGTPSVVLSTGDNPRRWAPLDTRRHRVLCPAPGVHPGDVLACVDDLLARDCPRSQKARPPCDLSVS